MSEIFLYCMRGYLNIQQHNNMGILTCFDQDTLQRQGIFDLKSEEKFKSPTVALFPPSGLTLIGALMRHQDTLGWLGLLLDVILWCLELL